MKEKFEHLKNYKENNRDEKLYCNNIGKGNFNIFKKYTISNNKNIDLVLNTILDNDDNFNWYINEIEKDALDLYNDNLESGEENKRRNLKSYNERRYEEKYKGQKRDGVSCRSAERNLETLIFKIYENNPHHNIGLCCYYQSPRQREMGNHRNIDLIFKKNNCLYLCELKAIDNKEGFLRCLSEVLTYYYVIKKNIKDDNSNKYFFKAFDKDFSYNLKYTIEPCLIIPHTFTNGISINNIVKRLENKDIHLKIVYIKDNSGNLE
jgi:hypothetical protein